VQNVDLFPDYLEVVTDYMDFSIIRDKIDRGAYTSISLFTSDINLIVNNTLVYFPEDEPSKMTNRALAMKDLVFDAVSDLDPELLRTCDIITTQLQLEQKKAEKEKEATVQSDRPSQVSMTATPEKRNEKTPPKTPQANFDRIKAEKLLMKCAAKLESARIENLLEVYTKLHRLIETHFGSNDKTALLNEMEEFVEHV
jgi:hypothetical protein